uniref:Uncharacterized protein n=1 Tax=Trichogramma kaykai TaxID=54128 RepID=A0ABD2XLT7_9HYME
MTHWNACATPDSEYSGSRSTLIRSWNARRQALKIENGRERMPPHNVRERIATHVYSLKTAKVSSVRRSPGCEFALVCNGDDYDDDDDDIQRAYIFELRNKNTRGRRMALRSFYSALHGCF